MELRTPFYNKHIEADANLLPGGGWRLVVNYRDVKEEIMSVINSVGFIDFSSMGTIYVVGKDAQKMLQRVVVNNVGRLKFGQGLYSQMVNENGTVRDDITIFCIRKDEYIVVTSTAKFNEDLKLFKEEAKVQQLEVSIIEASYGVLALSGPRSRDTLMKLTKDINEVDFFGIIETQLNMNNDTIPCLIARAGFTGELSFEIYVHSKYGIRLSEMLMEAGKEYDIQPIGLKAIDSLRLEKGYLSSGDFYPNASPIQLGVGWTICFDKGDFIGKEALLKQKEQGYDTKLVGFEVADTNDVVPVGSIIYKEDKCIGKITSANYGYRINKSIAMGWIDTKDEILNEIYEARDVNSDKTFKIKLVKRPFYDPKNKVLKS